MTPIPQDPGTPTPLETVKERPWATGRPTVQAERVILSLSIPARCHATHLRVCPDPQYTDEAREAKPQGRVTLRVLVGADGHASQIQVVQRIGMGLDDRAVQLIRSWKFTPARDGGRRAVPQWVTIEIIFRLI